MGLEHVAGNLAAVGFGACRTFFLYGLMKANHQRFQKVEQERDELRAENAILLKRVIPEAALEPTVATVNNSERVDLTIRSDGVDRVLQGEGNSDLRADISVFKEDAVVRRYIEERGWSGYLEDMDAIRRQVRESFPNGIEAEYGESVEGRSPPSDAELKRYCELLSTELYQFFADRNRDDPSKRLRLGVQQATTEEEKQRVWQNEIEEDRRYYEETMNLYQQKFEGSVLAVFTALRQRGWCDPEDRQRFESAINLVDIREIAQRLGAIGNQL